MRILFTRNNRSPFSRAIQWASCWDASHVAIEVEGMVFHSNLLGPKCDLLDDFQKKSEIVREISLENSAYDTIRLMHFFLKRNHKAYDFLLFLTLGIMLVVKKLNTQLGGQSPEFDRKLIFRTSGAYLCTEFVGEFLYGNENKFTLPEEIWESWKIRQE
jgi:hypothetical protein